MYRRLWSLVLAESRSYRTVAVSPRSNVSIHESRLSIPKRGCVSFLGDNTGKSLFNDGSLRTLVAPLIFNEMSYKLGISLTTLHSTTKLNHIIKIAGTVTVLSFHSQVWFHCFTVQDVLLWIELKSVIFCLEYFMHQYKVILCFIFW